MLESGSRCGTTEHMHAILYSTESIPYALPRDIDVTLSTPPRLNSSILYLQVTVIDDGVAITTQHARVRLMVRTFKKVDSSFALVPVGGEACAYGCETEERNSERQYARKLATRRIEKKEKEREIVQS